MINNSSYKVSQIIIIGDYGPSITVTAQWFAWKEAGTSDCADVAAFLAFVSGAKALCCMRGGFCAMQRFC